MEHGIFLDGVVSEREHAALAVEERAADKFKAQFPYPVTFEDFEPTYSQTVHGVEVYRALQLLVIKIDGQFYAAHR